MNTQKVLIATTNKGKLAELKTFLKDLPVTLVSLADVKIKDNVEEDGKTYKANSQKKALFYAAKSKLPTIADDGGIEINALHGAPGVKSRRWLGYEATDEELITYMKNLSANLPDDNRGAFFKTVVTFAMPNKKVWSTEGEVEGIIAQKPHMKILEGYPYRSFFYLPKLKKFYHESDLTQDEMKEYNHRYKAIEKLKPRILKELGIKNK
jgi:XTP/dITP diphosphohydrolase